MSLFESLASYYYEPQLVSALKDMLAPLEATLQLSSGSSGKYKGSIRVMRAPYKVEGFYPALSAYYEQQLALNWGLRVPTAKLVRERFLQGTFVEPQTQPASSSERQAKGYSPSMSDKNAMARHSSDVDKVLRTMQVPATSIVSIGKDWLAALKATQGVAVNFGWFTKTNTPYYDAPTKSYLWQPEGAAHDPFHWDYSQLVWLVDSTVTVDGVGRMPYDDALRSSEYCGLLSDEGPLEASPYPKDSLPIYRTLKLGTSGSDVAAWQNFLGVTVDGSFGPAVEDATKSFQSANGTVGLAMGLTSAKPPSVTIDGGKVATVGAAALAVGYVAGNMAGNLWGKGG
jgi:peptidoglycan hydrolase-like protein with peptidoglycan-binding domain